MATKWIFAAAAVILSLTAGCRTLGKNEVYERYYMTVLRQSTSAQVLGYIQNPKADYLSQSESVVAGWGHNEDGRTHWFNMVAFDEELSTAVRKYGFTQEDYRGPNTKPRSNLRFDAEAVMDSQVLNVPYANANAKQIEILRKLKKQFEDDAAALTHDSTVLKSSSMMVSQSIANALSALDRSPAFAADLPTLQGLKFDHIALGESRMRMLIEGDIVKLKIKCGKVWFVAAPFEQHPDVKDM